jgi:hypothetical protein
MTMIWRSNKTLLPGFPLGMPSVCGVHSFFRFKQAGLLTMIMMANAVFALGILRILAQNALEP